MLQGLIRCWHCHGNISGTAVTKAAGKTDRTYRHLVAKRGKECLFHAPAEIEDDIILACAEILRDEKELMRAIESSLANTRGDLQSLRRQRVELDVEIAKEKRKLERAAALLVDVPHAGPAREAVLGRLRGAEAPLHAHGALRAGVEGENTGLPAGTPLTPGAARGVGGPCCPGRRAPPPTPC